MKIANYSSDSSHEYNSGNWRGTIPARAVGKLPGHSYTILSVRQWLDGQQMAVRACNQADVIVIQRVAVEETLKYVREWRARGKTVLVDGDDDYFNLAPTNQAYRFWHEGQVEVTLSQNISYFKVLDRHPIDILKEILRVGSGGTTPGKMLVEDWKQYGNMYYLPNYVDSGRYLSVPQVPRNDGRIVIGYGGSMSHIQSFTESGINEALAKVVTKRKNVFVQICGDKRVWDNLPIADNRKMHSNYVKAHLWPKVLSQFDITVAPLALEYDFRRSDIKLTESCLMGIPIVYTRGPVYEDYEKEGVGLSVSSDAFDHTPIEKRIDEWELALLDMIDNLPEWRKKAQAHLEFVLELRDVDRRAKDIIGLYERIMAT